MDLPRASTKARKDARREAIRAISLLAANLEADGLGDVADELRGILAEVLEREGRGWA